MRLAEEDFERALAEAEASEKLRRDEEETLMAILRHKRVAADFLQVFYSLFSPLVITTRRLFGVSKFLRT